MRTGTINPPRNEKKLELRGEGGIFVCRYGYRGSLSVFEERKKKQGKQKISKKEVAQYLREQEKTKGEPINTALADALAKPKFGDKLFRRPISLNFH